MPRATPGKKTSRRVAKKTTAKKAGSRTRSAASEPIVNYNTALKYLHDRTDVERVRPTRVDATAFDLDRMRALMKALGDPQDSLRIVHIAGTNGKGSTVAMVASALRACGYAVGTYTSPHLTDVRERVCINEQIISHPKFTDTMATVDYWAEAPMNREQISLFAPTLDSMISDDDPVRLFDEVLAGIDWSPWEVKYDGRRGQPAIHPRYVAACILYGLCRGIRSSRKLEEACCYRLDFIWLLQGRQIDHTTFSKFRTKCSAPLKDLFKQIGRIAMALGISEHTAKFHTSSILAKLDADTRTEAVVEAIRRGLLVL